MMTWKRRLALAAASMFTALGFAASASAQAKDLDTAMSWLPPEVSTVVAFDLEGARKTPFFKEIQAELIKLTGFGRDLAQLKREAGLDVMATVETVVYAGPDEALKKAKQSIVVLEGTFDQAKIREYYEKKSKVPLTEKTAKGIKYFQIGDDACVAFDGNFAVFGSRALFEKGLESRAKKDAGKSTKVASLVARFKSSKHGFGVIAGSQTLRKFLGKGFGAVQDVNQAAMAFDFSSGFKLQIVGIFGDASKAANVASSIKTELADPELKELGIDEALSKVATSSSGPEVKIELALDSSAAQAFAKSLKELF